MNAVGTTLLRVDELFMSYGRRRSRISSRAGKNRAEAKDSSGAAVRGVSFTVEDGEFFTLLGPSGCGKTSTLRCVAGLETPDSGEIAVMGRKFFSSTDGTKPVVVPPQDRNIGMVFQSYAIWPHMTVFENAVFPLLAKPRRQRASKSDIRERVMSGLAAVGLDSMSNRHATNLSGGQQQRLALARAIVTQPPLLLLDEPLSNLDARLREQLRLELKRMQAELGITTLYVTHDQGEALSMSSRLAVMNHGKIIQLGDPSTIYERPSSRFVAEFIGTTNLIRGKVLSREHGYLLVQSEVGEMRAVDPGSMPIGSSVLLCMRPESLQLKLEASTSSLVNQLSGRVKVQAYLGASTEHLIAVGTRELRCLSHADVSLPAGADAYVSVSPEKVRVLPDTDDDAAVDGQEVEVDSLQ